MDDQELACVLGIGDDPLWPRVIAGLPMAKRALYERMARVTVELKLWQEGVTPKPEGVIVCKPRALGSW